MWDAYKDFYFSAYLNKVEYTEKQKQIWHDNNTIKINLGARVIIHLMNTD